MTTTIRDEFIGKEAEIVRSRNKQLLGLKGKIVDETRNSFKMLVNKRNFREFKMVLKSGNTFMIGRKVFEGSKIMKRPEDRIKLRD
ncbi:MAG: ribonuclease P component 1 family protein [Candidatus Woesearchaeota archaeon]